MIRVAWPECNDVNWQGGLNYFINLALALQSLPERRVDPVILGDTGNLPPPLINLLSVPIAEKRVYSKFWLKRRFQKFFLRKPESQIQIFERYGVRLFSHGWLLHRREKKSDAEPWVPVLRWLPDLQHKYLPEMFSEKELYARDRDMVDVATWAQGILFSSHTAKSDFLRFHPEAAERTHVLQFVAQAGGDASPLPARQVLATHHIDEPYFYIPNQLWKHKNHIAVLEALRILIGQGKCPLVISTGNKHDYRNPGYFYELEAKVAAAGLAERFRFLGLVDFRHVNVFIRNAVALINPSQFEGWSTTVEEGKSLGKRLLLSDIPAHREQAPERGDYFSPEAPEHLATFMRQTLENYSEPEEAAAAQRATEALPSRTRKFAETYEEIVLRVLGDSTY